MRKSLLFLAGCYGLASYLWAEPIYNYTATSGSITSDGGSYFTITASAPGFSFMGGTSSSELPPRFSVGQQIPLTNPLNPLLESGAATVDFGGTRTVVSIDLGDLRGSAQATASESSFVLPPNPNPTYTFPARMTGQFTA
ncbi:MAG: hypothetical protein JO182_05760, partial [Acidobacteriaceae bacterium]|nr:hypothetical protein [Acidobacteriaceae bacterium]